MHRHIRQHISIILLISALLFACSVAQADAVTDWNRIAGDVVVDAGLGASRRPGAGNCLYSSI